MPRTSSFRTAAAGLALALLLSGCAGADYLNRRDTVTLAAGDAVRANLERETLNPSKPSMYEVDGLGADGDVVTTGPVVVLPAAGPAT